MLLSSEDRELVGSRPSPLRVTETQQPGHPAQGSWCEANWRPRSLARGLARKALTSQSSKRQSPSDREPRGAVQRGAHGARGSFETPGGAPRLFRKITATVGVNEASISGTTHDTQSAQERDPLAIVKKLVNRLVELDREAPKTALEISYPGLPLEAQSLEDAYAELKRRVISTTADQKLQWVLDVDPRPDGRFIGYVRLASVHPYRSASRGHEPSECAPELPL